MSLSLRQLRRELQELKVEAAKSSNLCVFSKSKAEIKAEISKEIEGLKAKMQYYIDGGVFAEDDLTINMNWQSYNIPELTADLMQRWNNRHNLILNEKNQLYRDLGFFN